MTNHDMSGATQPKTAILLYGFLRTYEVTHASVERHVAAPNNADIFYFGPSTTDTSAATHAGTLDMFGNIKNNPKGYASVLSNIETDSLERTYGHRLKKHAFHHTPPEFFQSTASHISRDRWIFGLDPARLYSMFYNMEGAVKLLLEYEQETGTVYDQVIITRPDLAFYSPIVVNYAHEDTIPNAVHIPDGEGFDQFGAKREGNARALFYKNARTGDLVEGHDRVRFNDQILVFERKHLDKFIDLYTALDGYIRDGLPISPETILVLHLCSRGGLKIEEHKDWAYEIFRADFPVIKDVTDTRMIAFIDRYHPKAQAMRQKAPLFFALRDVIFLFKRALRLLKR